MRRAIALGAAAVGGAIALRALSPARRRRIAGGVRHRMAQRMERMMANLPEDAPPKLVMSVLPRLREQNEQIIAILREQNEILRQHVQATQGAPARTS
jgi:hypothetical protein